MKLQTIGYMSLSHAPTSIAPSNPWLGTYYSYYLWDANGNIKRRIGNRARRPEVREHYFNEENRLAAKSDWPGLLPFNTTISSRLASYLYSADGERVWKFAGTATMTYSNGLLVNSDLEMDKTFYPTPQTTFTKQKFYKHYFIGGERICTQVTQYVPPISAPNAVGFIHGSTSDFMLGMGNQVKHSLDSVGYSGNISIDPVFNSIGSQIAQRPQKYYYHYNHQGSVALVTWQNGTIRQHLQYLPYGGTFVDHRTGSYSSTYTFSAKEKDSESGYTYFGARYYSDGIMQWLSVDPMSDKYPSMSPYMYCAGNPIIYKDPTGMIIDPAGEDEAAAYKQYRDKVFSDPKYSHIQKELTRLEEAEEVFKIRMGDNVSNETAGGNFTYNNETGEFDINIQSWGDFSQEEKLAHELKHADQYLDGKIAFRVDKNGNVSPFFNFRENEEEAYYRQIEIGSRNINPSSIDNILNSKKEKDRFSLYNNHYQQFVNQTNKQEINNSYNIGKSSFKYVHKSLKY